MKELYQSIIEAIDYMLFYYSNLFGFAVEKEKITCEKRDMGKHGITYFTATVPKTNSCAYTVQEMRLIMQEYMEICVLPASKIPPYLAGEELLESLYVDSIREKEGNYIIEVIYIDNATAFRYVKNSKNYERRN
jgi:hypothetical protein